MRQHTARITRYSRIALGATTLLLVSACSSERTTAPLADDAATAVTRFTQLADSVARAGGDSSIKDAYASLAEAIRAGGRVSPLVITVDGVAKVFIGTAQQTDINYGPCAAEVCAAVVRSATIRSFIGWQQDDPRKVIQLSSAADTDPIRAYIYPVLVPFEGPSASLIYLDGAGGTFFGTSGSQKFGVSISSTPCTWAGSSRPIIAIHPTPANCVQADFTVAFSGKAEPSSFLASRNTATGSHTFSMASQAVLGARNSLVANSGPVPPITVTPRATLPATLTATVDSVVTLTFKISNPSNTPVTVQFSSGQHYDFNAIDAATGANVWTWSATRLFITALTQQVIPANASLTFSDRWTPPRKGSYVLLGRMTSSSHAAEAKTMVEVK